MSVNQLVGSSERYFVYFIANSQQEKDVLLGFNLKDLDMFILSYMLLSICLEEFPLPLYISLTLWTKRRNMLKAVPVCPLTLSSNCLSMNSMSVRLAFL